MESFLCQGALCQKHKKKIDYTFNYHETARIPILNNSEFNKVSCSDEFRFEQSCLVLGSYRRKLIIIIMKFMTFIMLSSLNQVTLIVKMSYYQTIFILTHEPILLKSETCMILHVLNIFMLKFFIMRFFFQNTQFIKHLYNICPITHWLSNYLVNILNL